MEKKEEEKIQPKAVKDQELKHRLCCEHERLHHVEIKVEKSQTELWPNDKIQKSKCLKKAKKKTNKKTILLNTSTGCGKVCRCCFKP